MRVERGCWSSWIDGGAFEMTALRTDMGSPDTGVLPEGVMLRALASRAGPVIGEIELFCSDWQMFVAPIQWNLVHSKANTLRGVHVHAKHWDYLCVLEGEMLLGLHDLRPGSTTYHHSRLQALAGAQPSGICIPPGVAHGFYFAGPAKYVYGTSEYWNMADELGCMWNDPELRLDWPVDNPILSPRDRDASSYADMTRRLVTAMRRDPAVS